MWSIVCLGRPSHLDRKTTTFKTFGWTDYIVEIWLLVDDFDEEG